MNKLTHSALAAGAAFAVLAGASTVTASAAPVALHADSLKAAVPAGATDVRWRGRRGAIGLGAFGIGVIAGAAIANSHNRYHYSQPYGYYDQPYGYAPTPYGYTGYGYTGYGYRGNGAFYDPNGGNY